MAAACFVRPALRCPPSSPARRNGLFRGSARDFSSACSTIDICTYIPVGVSADEYAKRLSMQRQYYHGACGSRSDGIGRNERTELDGAPASVSRVLDDWNVREHGDVTEHRQTLRNSHILIHALGNRHRDTRERGADNQSEKDQAEPIRVDRRSRKDGGAQQRESFTALLTLKGLGQVGTLQSVLCMLILILQSLFA